MSSINQDDSLLIAEFMQFFKGAKNNYGEHKYNFTENAQKEKGENKTIINTLLTSKQYSDHLKGNTGLGIIPIDENNNCYFSVIDIDIYDVNLAVYIKAVYNNNLPLVIFKTKSGGLHFYLFFKSAIATEKAVYYMQRLTSLLALDILVKQKQNKTVEIFPKQTLRKKGEIGNWINLPYYNYKDTKQYCVDQELNKLSLQDALLLIKKKVISEEALNKFFEELVFNDAPPCLQILYLLNNLDENSGRNDYLFSFGVYLKKKDENFFEQKLFDINQSLINPIEDKELENTILNSLRKKDYSYKCRQSPCVNYCNKKLCKEREYGVGKQGGYFSPLIFGKLTQLKTSQPYYEWEVKEKEGNEFKILRFRNEDEIIKQDAFLRLCFRELCCLPFKMKQAEWFKLVRQHLVEMEIKLIDEQEDGSPFTQFKNYFYEFLLSRALARDKADLLKKRVYLDNEKNIYCFRVHDLYNYLVHVKQFRYFENTNSLHAALRDIGAYATRTRAAGKQIYIIAFPAEQIPDYVLIQYSEFKPDFKQYNKELF